MKYGQHVDGESPPKGKSDDQNSTEAIANHDEDDEQLYLSDNNDNMGIENVDNNKCNNCGTQIEINDFSCDSCGNFVNNQQQS